MSENNSGIPERLHRSGKINFPSPEDLLQDEMITQEFQKKIRETVLDEAKKCVVSDRDNDYGSPESSFEYIAALWSDYLESEVTGMDVGLMLLLMKIARTRNSKKLDNFVDMAGYAACAAECREMDSKTKERTK